MVSARNDKYGWIPDNYDFLVISGMTVVREVFTKFKVSSVPSFSSVVKNDAFMATAPNPKIAFLYKLCAISVCPELVEGRHSALKL